MALLSVRDLYHDAGINLLGAVTSRRTQIEPDVEAQRSLKSSERSAKALIRIADRIEARLTQVLPASRLALLRIDETRAIRN